MVLSSTMRTLIGGIAPSSKEVGSGFELVLLFLFSFSRPLGRGEATREGGETDLGAGSEGRAGGVAAEGGDEAVGTPLAGG